MGYAISVHDLAWTRFEIGMFPWLLLIQQSRPEEGGKNSWTLQRDYYTNSLPSGVFTKAWRLNVKSWYPYEGLFPDAISSSNE